MPPVVIGNLQVGLCSGYKRFRNTLSLLTQSVQGNLYVRFLCFGNGSLSALHDRSYGFYRRQIILTVKDVPPDRVDDPYLIEKLQREADDIFLWCLEGLKRLLKINTALPSANVQRKICTKLWNPGITLSLLCSHSGISDWKKMKRSITFIILQIFLQIMEKMPEDFREFIRRYA